MYYHPSSYPSSYSSSSTAGAMSTAGTIGNAGNAGNAGHGNHVITSSTRPSRPPPPTNTTTTTNSTASNVAVLRKDRERERGEKGDKVVKGDKAVKGGRAGARQGGRAKSDRGGAAPTNNTDSNNNNNNNDTVKPVPSFEEQQQMTQRLLRQYLPRSPSSSLLPSTSANPPHSSNSNPFQQSSSSSSIQGQTYFLSAKSDIQALLGGDYDYSQRQKDLTHLLTLKEHISQKWDYKEKSTIHQHFSAFSSMPDNSNIANQVAHLMATTILDAKPLSANKPANSFQHNNENREPNKIALNVATPKYNTKPSLQPTAAADSSPLKGLNISKYEDWDVDNLPLSFKVAFWRTHHPGRPMPQPSNTKVQFQNNEQFQRPTALPKSQPQPPQPQFQIQPPAILPTIDILHDPPPFFSHNVTIRKTSVKAPELHKISSHLQPPHLLGNNKPKPAQHAACTQTISNAHTQTSPITKITLNDTADFTSQTISSVASQTTTHHTTQTLSHNASQTTDDIPLSFSSQGTSTSLPISVKEMSIQTNPIMESSSVQTQPMTRGVDTDTRDLPRSPRYIAQIETVPQLPLVLPQPQEVEIPVPAPQVRDQETHVHLTANHLENRVLQMLCDSILAQMVQDRPVPTKVTPTPLPPPPPPKEEPPNEDSLLRYVVGHMIAEDLFNSLKQPAPSPPPKPPSPPPPPRKDGVSSFFHLSDSGILSHHVELPPPPPPPVPIPVPPPVVVIPSPPPSPPPVKQVECKAIQTNQNSDIGIQSTTRVESIGIQANEPITIGVQTVQEVAVQVQNDTPTAEIATQSTPPPSPKPKTPPPKPKPKETSFITDTASDTSLDISDGEMMKEISDGEMVQRDKYAGPASEGTGNLAASAHDRIGSLFGSGRFGGKPSSRKSSLAYPSEGELDHYISEGEMSLEDSRTQYSEGEIVLYPQSEGEELALSRSQSHFFSEGELSMHESEGEM